MNTDTPKIAYKVLQSGKSCHGGALAWSLPTQNDDGSWTPGEWHEVTGKVAVCSNGLHLTHKPAYWWQAGADVYEAEYSGDVDSSEVNDDEKIAAQRCRLLRPVAWADHQVWTEGAHTANAGRSVAFGSATVRAFDSATVREFDSATVRAFGSATVEAFGSATVRAFDSATVRAFGSATVEAFGSATVRAFGSATVRAFDSATVRAFGSANVIRARWHSGGWVKLEDLAAVIDRRADGTVAFHAAPWSDAPAVEDAAALGGSR